MQRLQLDLLVGDLVALLLHQRLRHELLLAGEPLVALHLVARALDAYLLQLHLAVDLGELVLQVVLAAADLFHLLVSQLAPLGLLLLQDAAPGLHLRGHRLARGGPRAGAAVEGDRGHGGAGLHLFAFLDEELRHAARVGNEHARGAGIEREIAFHPLAALVLAPQGDGDEEQGGARGKEREDPGRDGSGDGGLAEKLLALGVDRLLSE